MNNTDIFKQLRAMDRTIEKITLPEHAYVKLFKYRNRRQESFFVLTLNGAHALIKKHEVTRGLVNQTQAHPREIFRTAIKDNAVSIIIAHNHPSNQLLPSSADNELTKIVTDAGKLIGIRVIDHIIFGKSGFYSYLEHGLL